MPPRPTSFLEKLTSYLSYFEIIALLVSFVGLTLLYLNVTGSRQLILVGFTALAIIYFLLAFTLPPVSESENEDEPERGGFLDLFLKSSPEK